MPTLGWIVVAGILMAAVALVGGLLVMLIQDLDRVLVPLVGLAAGSLLGGAFFHLLPMGLRQADDPGGPMLWFVAGFVVFFLVEQLLHRHHCRRADRPCRDPVTYLILLGDGLHNFIGGLAIGGAFVVDVRLGLTAWLAAVAHEVPQELGDFAVLVRGGWSRKRQLRLGPHLRRGCRPGLRRVAERRRRLPPPLRRGELCLDRRLRPDPRGLPRPR